MWRRYLTQNAGNGHHWAVSEDAVESEQGLRQRRVEALSGSRARMGPEGEKEQVCPRPWGAGGEGLEASDLQSFVLFTTCFV